LFPVLGGGNGSFAAAGDFALQGVMRYSVGREKRRRWRKNSSEE